MRSLLVMRSALALALIAVWGSPSRAAEESLLVIVHGKSNVERVTSYELEALFTRNQTRWSDGSSVYPFSFPAGSQPRESFDRTVLRLDPEQVGRFWLDRRIRGLGQPPKQVPNATMMVQIVSNLPGAIGYIPASHTPRTGVKVVARVVQGKVVAP